MSWTIDRADVFEPSAGMPRYAQIADAIQAALGRGDLRPGDRLPTVRALAKQLGVSSASVAVAYSVLERRGHVEAHVGRGTFVRDEVGRVGHSPDPARPPAGPAWSPQQVDGVAPAPSAWRRRSLLSGDRLRAMRPAALPCSSSWPDPNLLPVEAVKRAYVGAIERTRPSDLQYSTPEVHPELAAALLPRLAKDGLVAEAHQLIVVNSFNQLLTLVLQVAPALVGGPTLGVAVEEPGYHTALQLIERHGHRLLGVETDGEGMLPGSLRAALAQGARLVLVTPRALNPTGASWTADRRAALADVLGEYPGVLILEDDHFAGIAGNPPGALFNDLRLQDRTIHARSFSKSIGPDLRMTAVVSSGRLQAGLRETKLSAGGWTSRLGQRALAAALEDPALDQALERARAAYAERRDAAIEAITARLPGAVIAPAASGLNLWISLPPGCDAQDVIQNAAHLGVLVASGEPFYVRPGRRDAIRLSIGRVDREAARRAGELLSQAVLTLDDVPTSLVV